MADNTDPIVQIVTSYRQQADDAKKTRMEFNRQNFDMYHLKHDFSHKKSGQSQEILAKQATAVEQITSFIEQGLVDQSKFFGVETRFGVKDGVFVGNMMESLLERQLQKNKFSQFVNHSTKLGLLGSIMICKVHGTFVKDVEFVAAEDENGIRRKLIRQEKPIWQLKLDLVRQEDYYPDPTGEGLYECQDIEMDWHKAVEIAKANPSVYDVDAVMGLSGFTDDQREKRSRETGQNTTFEAPRKRVKFTECWGTFVNSKGEVVAENAVATIANDSVLVRPPQPNPFWHGMSPFVVSPIITVPHSVWHKALMDAPTKHNRALVELYNLMMDAAMMGAFGIRQIREDWLSPEEDISNGIPPGKTLLANSQMPPGAKVMETVATGSLAPETLQMFSITDREFQNSAITNDLRFGNFPNRSVKATEVVAVNQSTNSVFGALVKGIEQDYIKKILERSWQTMAQHMNDLDTDEVRSIIGDEAVARISLVSNEERFARTVNGHNFRVFGLSQTLNKIQDFRKIQAMLQTIAGSETLSAEFQAKHSFSKLLDEIMKSLDIDTKKIELTQEEIAQRQAQQQAQQQALAELAQNLGAEPDNQSQTPQASAGGESNILDLNRQGLNAGITEPAG